MCFCNFHAPINVLSATFFQLQNQLEAVRKELSRRVIDLEAAHQQLQYEKDEKVFISFCCKKQYPLVRKCD